MRHWCACKGHLAPEFIGALEDVFGREDTFLDTSEASIADHVVWPLLKSLGYPRWSRNKWRNGFVPDYDLGNGVALEIKRAKSGFEHIGAKNNTKRYETVAHQLVTYLDRCKLKTMLYFTVEIWCRLERDSGSGQLHALVFDMRRAHSQFRLSGSTRQLSYFFPFFHGNAFRLGNTVTIPISHGDAHHIEPAEVVGPIWLRRLNNGFRNLEARRAVRSVANTG